MLPVYKLKQQQKHATPHTKFRRQNKNVLTVSQSKVIHNAQTQRHMQSTPLWSKSLGEHLHEREIMMETFTGWLAHSTAV